MLLFDLSPMYIKCAIKIKKDSKELHFFEKSLLEIQSCNYFKFSLSLEINGYKYYFLKINVVKIEDFKQSNELKAIKAFLALIRLSQDFKELSNFNPNTIDIDSSISKEQDLISTTNLIEKNINEKSNSLDIQLVNDISDQNQANKIPAYYCGILKNNIGNYIEELFECKLIKCGHINQLTILGLDYIFYNIKNSFFFLPGQKIHNLVKVGKLDEVTEKNYTNIDDNLYSFVMANILEGTSLYKVEDKNTFYRIGGTSFGSSSYWSLVSMICGYDDPEKAVEDAIKGNNDLIDLSVQDIYGGGYGTFNLDSSLIASSFGKIKHINDMSQIERQDISRSLMTLFCVTASQICAFLAKQEKITNILIVGNSFESLEFMQMVQMCVNYYSEDKCKAYFTEYSPFINLIGMAVYMKI